MTVDLSNPFAGMNPWLMAHWHTVHASFLTYARDQISAQLPPGLAALTEERVMIENFRDDIKKGIVPDIAVEESWDGGGPALGGEGNLALAEPLVVMLEDPVDRCIQIVDSSGALITAIELLSVTNKQEGRGQRAYLSKQRTYQEGGVNLVEIDLVLNGPRILRAPTHHFGTWEECPYGVSIWRAAAPDRADAYPIQWRQRLPRIPIPLRKEDREAVLDLQPVLDETYLKGRYAYLIRYGLNDLYPPLPRDVREWAGELLTRRGLLGS